MPLKKTAILQFQIVSTKLKSFVCANPAETENSGQMRGPSDKIVMICANGTELYPASENTQFTLGAPLPVRKNCHEHNDRTRQMAFEKGDRCR
jgi:hypothetical protein